MGCCKKVLTVGSVLVAVLVGMVLYNMLEPAQKPQMNHDEYWGPGPVSSRSKDVSIKPFKINVSDAVLQRLQADLESVQLTDSLEGTHFEYGFNSVTLKKVVDFWRTKYDWRKREVFLNKYPHFKTNIQGLDMHFMHIKPKVDKNTKVVPIVLMHGWPGSIKEFYEMIPMLTTKREGVNFVFEVIVPSLPGYGFSQGASKQGLGIAQVAVVMRNLMNRIGYKQYYLQGGDWGSAIASIMSKLYPEEVLGTHLNMCVVNTPLSMIKYFVGAIWPSLFVTKEQEAQMYPLGAIYSNLLLEMGYMHLQATKPDTVGVALRDSPVGLAAYILEKFSTWTEGKWRSQLDGGLTKKFKMEDLLDNIMIYYVTGSITTSVRLYAESLNKAQMELNLEKVPNNVPIACAKFPNELLYQTDFQLKEVLLNLVQSTDMPRGGHFAAFEEPQLLADDVWSAVGAFEKLASDKVKRV